MIADRVRRALRPAGPGGEGAGVRPCLPLAALVLATGIILSRGGAPPQSSPVAILAVFIGATRSMLARQLPARCGRCSSLHVPAAVILSCLILKEQVTRPSGAVALPAIALISM